MEEVQAVRTTVIGRSTVHQDRERPTFKDKPGLQMHHRIVDSGITNSSDLPPVPLYAIKKSPQPMERSPVEAKNLWTGSFRDRFGSTHSRINRQRPPEDAFSIEIDDDIQAELSAIDNEIQAALAAAEA